MFTLGDDKIMQESKLRRRNRESSPLCPLFGYRAEYRYTSVVVKVEAIGSKAFSGRALPSTSHSRYSLRRRRLGDGVDGCVTVAHRGP